MFDDPQTLLRIVLGGSAFVLVLSVWIGGVIFWASRRFEKKGRVRRRLGIEVAAKKERRVLRLWRDGQEMSLSVAGGGRAPSRIDRIERTFEDAALPMSIGQIILLIVGMIVLTFGFLLVISGSVVVAIGVVLAVLVIFRIYIQQRVSKQRSLFETQFMDALELAARSLRAGHPMMAAFRLISEEMEAPVSNVFGEICQAHEMGKELDQVLIEASRQSSSEDMNLFATSVAIQLRSGGNLADLLDRLARLIRERMRVGRRVRVLTAQTQTSKRVLMGLPFATFIVMNVINPDYMRPFFTEFVGQILLAISVVMLIIGSWVMNKMAELKY